MANYANLKAAIDAVIKANGQQEITGPLLNQVLKAMVNALGAGYLFMGIAEHDTNPNTPDQNVFYIALEEGTYTHFGNAQVHFGISLLFWYGQWSVYNLVTFSNTVTDEVEEIPTSYAVFNALKDAAVYDVTAHTGQRFANLNSLLSSPDIDTLIPPSVRKAGMTIMFTSPAHAVQQQSQLFKHKFFFNAVDMSLFTNVNRWIGIETTVTQYSLNVPTSGAVFAAVNSAKVETIAEAGVYDVTANNDGATFASLSALLNDEDLDTLIPVARRKGGMSIKFVCTSDNKYVRYNLLADDFSTDVEDWEQTASVAQLEELEDKAVMTGSYDATVAVGLADNLRGDDVVSAEFYYRKTGGSHNVGSGIAAIKEMRGKSIAWNQKYVNKRPNGTSYAGITFYTIDSFSFYYSGTATATDNITQSLPVINGHKYYFSCSNASDGLYIDGSRIYSSSTIKTASSSSMNLGVTFVNGKTYSNAVIYKPKFVDLTLMFGAGNEPATAAEFEKMFPLDYYEYNAGEVIPFAGQNLVTTGKNQYNPTSGKANLLGGQQYQISGTYTSATIDGVAVTLDSNNCFTTTQDCTLDVTGGNDTDTIVALYNGENVTFEPYEKHTLPLDPSQWRDKQGNLVFPYGGMHGVGTAYDYAKVDADGYIRKAVRCFEQVDLGSLNWTYQDSYKRFYTRLEAYKQSNIPNLASPLYIGTKAGYFDTHLSVDKIMCDTGIPSGKDIYFRNLSYSDSSNFKTAMNGVMLIFELAEPIEIELATPVYAKYLVDKDGTEEVSPANGAAPYTTPANLSILYAMDARGTIANLPKNYLSKESAENMLNAMVAAGVIASYTMTFDNATGQYVFVINNVQPNQNE